MLTFGEWATQLERSVIRAKNELEIPTEAVMKAAETLAKEAIGTYEFGWPPLKPATIARKANGDTPLLETGEMRDSIRSEAELTPYGAEGVIGSSDMKAVWQELGTSRGIPPRPFLAGALMRIGPTIEAVFGKFAASLLALGR